MRLIREHRMLAGGERIIVGVSGGLDSVVLLAILARLRHALRLDVHCAHLNHQFRGSEADRDAEFVRGAAAKLGIPCYIESRNAPAFAQQHKLSPQDAARQLRYAFFETLAQQIQAQQIATAHTADDQAETVLLGLIRGVGLHGLGGIQPVLNQKIIRPLLTTTRAQIEAYAQAEGLAHVEDSSNASRKYVRNAIRLDLLPLLKQQFNPAIVPRLTAQAETFQEDAAFIKHIVAERYAAICENVAAGVKINLDLFAKEYMTIRRGIIYRSVAALAGTQPRLETKHARAAIALLTGPAEEKRLTLPGGIIVWRREQWGYFSRATARPASSAAPPTELAMPGETHFGEVRIETEILTVQGPAGLVAAERNLPPSAFQDMDYERITPPVTVRYRAPGDRFRPLGMDGQKTLKKFFIDRKIPADKRNRIPLMMDQHGIFWVVGERIAERVKITPATQKILRCRVRQDGNGQK